MNHKILNMFIRFLKDNGLYNNFINSYYIVNGSHVSETIIEYIKGMESIPDRLFTGSFVWMSSKDGHNFWYEWDERWKGYLSNINT